VTTLAEQVAAIVSFIALQQARDDERTAWWNGTVTGGPNGDGTYPFTANDSTVAYFPCVRKLAASMAKGDRGSDARQDLTMFAVGPMAAGEHLALFVAASAVGLSGTAYAVCEAAATADAHLTVTKNGALWATITFTAGSQTGTTVFSGSSSLSAGDVLRLIAPTTADVTLSSVAITFQGV
jgi:hypothetical protein